ncbi:MAG: tetratricopeptide repeat protein, partial [Arenimonas sp.]
VLPFVDMSQGKDQEYFSDGLSEQLLNGLAQVPELRVAGRTSSFHFKGRNEDLRAIGRQLNVATVLEGSVARSGDTLRITAQLINTDSGFHLWSQTYDRQFTGVFALQDEIVASVVAALKVKLLPGQAPVATRSKRPEAYDQYLLGRDYWRQQNMAGWHQAVTAYRRATELDPGFAAAWAGLAAAASEVAYEHADPADVDAAQKQARVYAQQAIDADPGEAEGYAIRGRLRSEFDFDQAGALADLQRALAINPGNSDTHQMAGTVFSALGRFEEAESELGKALALDPLNARALDSIAELFKDRGDLRQAEVFYRRALELVPKAGYSLSGLAQTQVLQGKHADALATVARIDGDRPRQLYNLVLVRHALGDRARSDAALEELRDRFGAGWAYQIGVAHGWRGERDLAFQWFERAYRQHDGGLILTRTEPLLAGVRDDPRFPVLLRKLGLESTNGQAAVAR